MKVATIINYLSRVAFSSTDNLAARTDVAVPREEDVQSILVSLSTLLASVGHTVKYLTDDPTWIEHDLERLISIMDSASTLVESFAGTITPNDFVTIKDTGDTLLDDLAIKRALFARSNMERSVGHTSNGLRTLLEAMTTKLPKPPALARDGTSSLSDGAYKLGEILEPVLFSVRNFSNVFPAFVNGDANTVAQANLVAMHANHTKENLEQGVVTIDPVVGNVTKDEVIHIENVSVGLFNATRDSLNLTQYAQDPPLFTADMCNTFHWIAINFHSFFPPFITKLASLQKTNDVPEALWVNLMAGLTSQSNDITIAWNQTAIRCYEILMGGAGTTTLTSILTTTTTPPTLITTTAAGLPGVIVVSVINTVTGPCTCASTAPPMTPTVDSVTTVTTTFMGAVPGDTITTVAPVVTGGPIHADTPDTTVVSVFDTVTVPCICATSTSTSTGKSSKHSTSLTSATTTEDSPSASPTDDPNGAVANVAVPMGLMAGMFIFLSL